MSSSNEPLDHTASPATPWRRLPGWERVSWSLGAICVGLAIVALAGLLQSILLTQLVEELRNAASDHDFDFDAWGNRIQLYEQVFSLIIAAGYGLLAFALLRLGATPSVPGARTIGAVGCAAMALCALDQGLTLMSMIGDKPGALMEFTTGKGFMVTTVLVYGAAMASLLLLISRLSSAVGRPLAGGLQLLAWLWIAWEVGYLLVRILLEPELAMRGESPWTYLALTRGAWLIGLVLFGVMAMRAFRALERPSSSSSGAGAGADNAGGSSGALDEDTRWLEVASGLELYASALSWRIFLTMGLYLILIFAAFSGSAGLSKFLIFSMPAIAVITSIVMLVGLLRYARQPHTSPAGGAAWLAGALMGFSVLMEFYGFFLILRLLTVDDSSYREMRELMASAQSLSVWSMGVGFGSLLTLLISFGQLGRYMGQSKLVDRVVGTGVFFAIIAFLVVGFRSYVADVRAYDGGTIITLGALTIMSALVGVIVYLNLVNAVARAIRENQSETGLPSARAM